MFVKNTGTSVFASARLAVIALILASVVVAVVSGKELYPYPSAPLFSDIAQLNFEGFALNLPMVKK